VTSRSFLGLGSNLGDRLANLGHAVSLLGRDEDVRVVRSSRVYETDPVGGPEQPEYLNAVIEAETSRSARDLLARCLEIEREMGRVRAERWGPRVIDIDVLTYDDLEIDEPGLTIPHPRMHERGFVLVPLLELVADPVLPGGQRVKELRLSADTFGGVRLFGPPLAIG
jgi:2-amino-4-hydroxy-6-hydroxymethyldihydropteridine diphosphokinase